MPVMSVPGGVGTAGGFPSKLGFPAAGFGGAIGVAIGVDAISFFLSASTSVEKRVSDGFKYVCLLLLLLLFYLKLK